ncbi:MAG: hypothetical protein M1836_001565 [Candelina mexicana]|nr:MAG: hypothetical protein M1836_001565 [Candelina mexicana]
MTKLVDTVVKKEVKKAAKAAKSLWRKTLAVFKKGAGDDGEEPLRESGEDDGAGAVATKRPQRPLASYYTYLTPYLLLPPVCT